MKTIVQFNPDINIESHSVGKLDIVLVFKDDEPIGYVHQDKGFKLYANFFSDTLMLEEREEEIFETLGSLILSYPELQFKIVE
jgi:hypothetical protein